MFIIIITPCLHVEIVVDPGILVPRKYLTWQKIFDKMLALNFKIDYNVRINQIFSFENQQFGQ